MTRPHTAAEPLLIYCAAKQKRYARIAQDRGFAYGAQLPNRVYFPPVFVDQDWKRPDRAAYIYALSEYRPALASVLDWEHEKQYDEVMQWANLATLYATEAVIIIPKVNGGIKHLPRKINGVEVRLGFSIPTSHGGTKTSYREFESWPIHALGGEPSQQIALSKRLNVVSADANWHQKLAKRAQYWRPETPAKHYSWPTLGECGLRHLKDAPYIAFELSCIAIRMAWQGYDVDDIRTAQDDFLPPVSYQRSLWQVAS